MKNKKIIYILLIIIISTIALTLNKKSFTYIGINHEIFKIEIPIYLKVYNFYQRHNMYKKLVREISDNTENKKYILLNTMKWIKQNIKKIPEDIDVIDNHPSTIIDRKVATNDQFSDLLSVLLVYSNIDSFFDSENKHYKKSITFFKINEYWSVADPFYGILFLNRKKSFASIKDLKKGLWTMVNLDFNEINDSNYRTIFQSQFDDYNALISFYNQTFMYLPSNNKIEKTNIFERGGRSHVQNPYGRLKYEIYKKLNK